MVGEGLLEAYAEGISLFIADAEYVAAQVDDGALYARIYQIVLHPVGDIALGDGTQVDGDIVRAKSQGVSREGYVPVIHPGHCLADLCIRGHFAGILRKVPEGAHGLDGDIVGAIGLLCVFQGLPEESCRVIGEGKGVFPGLSVVYAVYLAGFDGFAEDSLILFYQREGSLQNRLVRVIIQRDGHKGVQLKPGLGEGFGLPFACAGSKQDCSQADQEQKPQEKRPGSIPDG